MAGLGAESVIQLAKHSPARIYLSSRNAKTAEVIIKQVADAGSSTAVSFVECDLASLLSVKKAADFAHQGNAPRRAHVQCRYYGATSRVNEGWIRGAIWDKPSGSRTTHP
jgi:hypothetical protein